MPQTESEPDPPESEFLQVQEPETPRKAPYSKILSASTSFFVAGINDGSLGSLIPYVMETYGISTNMVSILYGCTFSGWLAAALSNGSMTRVFDLGWILAIRAILQIIAHALRCWGPPLPLYAVTFFAASLGQAFNDTHANTFVSSLEGSHRYLGFIHAMYMAGCLIGPLVATAVATAVSASNPTSRWAVFYAFPLGIAVVNLTLVTIFFRDRFHLGSKIKKNAPSTSASGLANGKSAWTEIKAILSTPSVWLLSLYFFFFLGASITAGGWLVEYLTTVRGGNIASIGYVLTGFYGGGFLGRLLLAEPTYRLGQRRMIFIYALICVALQLVFWLVPNIIVEAVAVSLLGFFLGPFFATGINVGTRIFPPESRSSSIAFVFVLGQVGGSILPAITGILAAKKGVQVLQPMLLGFLGAAAVSWLILPSEPRRHRN